MIMAQSRSLRFHQLPFSLAVVLIIVLLLFTFVTRSFDRFYFDETREDLYRRALLIGRVFQDKGLAEPAALQALSEILRDQLNTRITLIDPGGRVLVDSNKDPGIMDNHADRPEIKGARKGDPSSSRRYSYTLEEELLYLAIPLELDGQPMVLRTAVSTQHLHEAVAELKRHLAWGAILVSLLGFFLSVLFSQRVQRPLQMLQEGAIRYAGGELDHRLPAFSIRELGSLSRSMNEMASQIQARMNDITSRRDEMGAILASMTEGVIAIGSEDRILSMNKAARRMLEVKKKEYRGRTVQEVLRHSELIAFLDLVDRNSKPVGEEINLHRTPEQVIRLTGTRLTYPDGEPRGRVIVLNDITGTRKLEQIRQEFVANVSHELKTPITSIQGYIETLREEDISREQSRKFLAIIHKHVERLNAIIGDLLQLSRLEEPGSAERLHFERCNVSELLTLVMRNAEHHAKSRGIEMRKDAEEFLELPMDRSLMEHALNNLVDNALKFCPEGSHVQLSGKQRGKGIVLSVKDDGPGIPRDKFGAIFE